MDENKQEKLSIVRFFFVALLISIAIFLAGMVLKLGYGETLILCGITFEIFLVNAVYSNHIIKQVSNIQDSIDKLKETVDNFKVKPKE